MRSWYIFGQNTSRLAWSLRVWSKPDPFPVVFEYNLLRNCLATTFLSPHFRLCDSCKQSWALFFSICSSSSVSVYQSNWVFTSRRALFMPTAGDICLKNSFFICCSRDWVKLKTFSPHLDNMRFFFVFSFFFWLLSWIYWIKINHKCWNFIRCSLGRLKEGVLHFKLWKNWV